MPDQPAMAGPFRRIMVCVALSPHAGAIVRDAEWLARLCGAELAFVHAGEEEADVRRIIRESLPESCPLASEQVIVRPGGAERVILSEARRWDADLLFAGTLASGPIFSGVLGSVARRLARHADRTVYLSLHNGRTAPALRTLVMAMEFDAESSASAAVGVALARRVGTGAVHFVHEYDPRARGAIESVLRGSEQVRYEQMLAGTQRFQLANAIEGLDLSGFESRLVCLEGKELTATTAYAREVNADLLVMPAPQHRLGLLDRFFGDPTETVLQRFPCSVLLVRGGAPNRGQRA